MKKRILKISLVIVLIALIILLAVWILAVLPKDKGDYRIEDYAYEVDLFKYDSEKTYDEVHNIYDACWIATNAVSERFPEERFLLFSTEYERWVYYDGESDTWFVYFALSDPDVLGGGYACVIASDGEVIACWGYE